MTDINRASEAKLTPEMVREILIYCPLTGSFKWRATRGQRAKAGQSAGRVEKSTGYVRIGIDGKDHMAHRLAWAYMLGRWPENLVDHENRVRSDNRWINLRPATYAQNNQNRTAVVVASSGLKGAFLDKRAKKPGSKRWVSSIQVNGKPIHLGNFHTAEEAHQAYVAAAKKYHGEFNVLEKA